MIDPRWCRELNERRQALAVSTLADEQASVGSGAMAYTSGAGWICKAVAVDLEGPLTADDAQAIVSWFREREVPPVLELTSLSGETTFRVAAEAGFVLAEVENVYAMEPRAVSLDPPEGITLRRLDPTDERALRRFAEIVSSGFVPEGGLPPEPVVESGMRSQRLPTSVGVLACRDDGEPVAASGTEIVEIECGLDRPPDRLLALCGTTVLPAYRRRGIQQALMAARLTLGADRGCAAAVVESKPGLPTERNAARMGFTLAYTRLVFRG